MADYGEGDRVSDQFRVDAKPRAYGCTTESPLDDAEMIFRCTSHGRRGSGSTGGQNA